jgi:nanoRNase/pAp phosphatase (c-di-AMP/oligoRNAs hydrolase)
LVNTIAQFFGGGGHSFAAGAKVVGTLEETVSIVVDKTKEVMTEQEQATK